MFSRWGAFVYRFRRPVALIAVVIAVASSVLATQTSSALSSGGWLDAELGVGRGVGPSRHRVRGGQEFGHRPLPVGDAGRRRDVGRVPGRDRDLGRRVSPATPHVTGVVGYAETGDKRFISTAGDAAYVVIQLDMTDEASVEAVDDVRAGIVPPAGFSYQLTGYGPITKDSAEQSEKDLQKAELVSLPIVAIVLVLVFASLVAAEHAAAGRRPRHPEQPGAHLSRRPAGRDEHLRAQHRDDARASPWPSTTRCSSCPGSARNCGAAGPSARPSSGRSPPPARPSRSAASRSPSGCPAWSCSRRRPSSRSASPGSIVVLCSVVFALTFLPAVLGMLGHRVNALSIGGLRHRFRPVADGVEVARTSRWERVAHAVMRRPIAVLVPTLAFLLILGIPFLRLQQGVPGAEIYPAGVESRDAYVALQTEFAPGETTPIVILADVTGAPTDLANIKALTDYAATIAAIERHRPGRGSVHHPRPGDRHPPHARAGRRALRAAGRPAAARPRRAAGPVRPRFDGPPRRDQPAVAVAARGDRPHPDRPGHAGGHRHHDPGRRQRGDRSGLPRLAGGARAVCDRADAVRERADPVPAVRFGGHPAQGDR